MAVSGPQAVRRGRHGTPQRHQGVRHRREPSQAIHGRLDFHLHRARPHLGEPLQEDEVLHRQRDGYVSGSGEKQKLKTMFRLLYDPSYIPSGSI